MIRRNKSFPRLRKNKEVCTVQVGEQQTDTFMVTHTNKVKMATSVFLGWSRFKC